MRSVRAVCGILFVLVGTAALITGEAVIHGAWLVTIALTALGIAGLVAASSAVSR